MSRSNFPSPRPGTGWARARSSCRSRRNMRWGRPRPRRPVGAKPRGHFRRDGEEGTPRGEGGEGDPKLVRQGDIQIPYPALPSGGTMNGERSALTVRSSFSAAHRMLEHEGNCERLHGHNWQVEVTVESGVLDSTV